MKHRKLGTIEVSAVGMGMMGFTHAYGLPPEERESIRLVHEAFELGCNFFDTAEMYSHASLSDAEYAEINAALETIKVYGSRDGKDIKKLGSVPTSVVR